MSELAPLSPRLSAILERARNHPPLPVAVVDAQEAHVLAGVVEESSNESLPEHIVRNGFLCPLPGGNRTRRRARKAVPGQADAAARRGIFSGVQIQRVNCPGR